MNKHIFDEPARPALHYCALHHCVTPRRRTQNVTLRRHARRIERRDACGALISAVRHIGKSNKREYRRAV